MSVDVDVAKGGTGTATSQKRNDPSDAWSTTDVLLEDPPPTPPRSAFNRFVKIMEHWQNLDPYNPGSPAESVASSPGSPTGSTGGSPPPSLPPMPHAEPSDAWADGHFLSQPGWSVNPGAWPSTGHQLAPQNPAGGSPLPPLPHAESVQDYPTSANLADWSENPGSDSEVPTDHHVVTRPEPIRRPLSDWVLDELLKGRLKRRVSDSSGTVSSVQRDPRSTDFQLDLLPPSA
jgi:hypothetical protein